LEIFPVIPNSLCAFIAELFQILTKTNNITKCIAIVTLVEPLFLALTCPKLSAWGRQHYLLQKIVNILKKPRQCLLTPNQAIEPFILFLASPSQIVQ
jgi:hypothetical protein